LNAYVRPDELISVSFFDESHHEGGEASDEEDILEQSKVRLERINKTLNFEKSTLGESTMHRIEETVGPEDVLLNAVIVHTATLDHPLWNSSN